MSELLWLLELRLELLKLLELTLELRFDLEEELELELELGLFLEEELELEFGLLELELDKSLRRKLPLVSLVKSS